MCRPKRSLLFGTRMIHCCVGRVCDLGHRGSCTQSLAEKKLNYSKGLSSGHRPLIARGLSCGGMLILKLTNLDVSHNPLKTLNYFWAGLSDRQR